MDPTKEPDSNVRPKEQYAQNDASQETGSSEVEINASGHVQELERNFSLLSLVGMGLNVGSVWPAAAGSILIAIANGGSPGVIYEYIAVCLFYFLVAASIAELASAIPSSAGVYQWATITPGKRWGRPIGFFAGYWNWLGWTFGLASQTSIVAQTIVQMWALKHPDFVTQSWHIFVVYILIAWISCFIVCGFNRLMPYLNQFGLWAVVTGFFITVITVAVMPDHHASSATVWTEWSAEGFGWYPNGFIFVTGMLNGAYSIGTPDATSHIAEEIPNAQRNLPIAIAFQLGFGFITGLAFLIATMYSINDYDALAESSWPIAEIYRQATGTVNGSIGLLFVLLMCIFCTVCGLYITCGRTLWALSRDGATPFPKFLCKVDRRLNMPLNATVVTACLITCLGAIYVGSTTAFNAFIGSYIQMSTSSYVAAILPNILTGRKNVTALGPFRLGKLGFVINGISCAFMVVWFIIYCFPAAPDPTAQTMNYASVLWGGFTILVGAWWFIGARKGYHGPPVVTVGESVVDGQVHAV